MRLRRQARRQAMRAVLGVLALVFLLAGLAALHVAGYIALRRAFMPLSAVLIVAACDLAIALVFATLAARDRPDRLEREALQVREAAGREIMATATMASVVAPLLRAVGLHKLSGLATVALTAWYLGRARAGP